jgi:three-Cys-motif partner protein
MIWRVLEMAKDRKKLFFDEMKEWSHRKLQIVSKYLDGFVRILGGQGTIYYVDGFAGRGIYEKHSKGSPILAAEIAKKLEDEGKPYTLICINVEKDEDNFRDLQQSTAIYGSRVINFQGTFENNLDKILGIIGNQPAIFFLDDFGVIGIGWNAVRKVISRKAPTDLWVRFDHTIVRRLDGFFNSESVSAEKKFNRLRSLYGITDRNKLHERLAGSSSEIRIINALNLYLECLAKEYISVKGKGYSYSYLIRTITGTRKYHLVFAAAHAKAAILASDIVYGTEKNYQLDVEEFRESQTAQPFLFPVDPTEDEIFTHLVNQIKDEIWELWRGKKVARIDIHESLLENWFGKISRKHVSQALKKLINEGRIEPPQGAVSNDYTKFIFKNLS